MTQKSKVCYLPWDQKDRFEELLEIAGIGAQLGKDDFTAIKIHFGERGGDGYVSPKWVRPIAKAIRKAKAKPFITDTNTIYRGARSDAVSHLVVAAEHGFSQTKIGVPVVIADGLRGTSFEPIEVNGTHFKEVKIATEIANADSMIVVTHSKGHLLVGYGGALKNLGMGCGAKVGKYEMHAGTNPEVNAKACVKCGQCIVACPAEALSFVKEVITVDTERCVGCGQCVAACDYGCLNIPWSQPSMSVQERVAEYAFGAVKNKRIFCINFVNHITPNCDCMGTVEKPLMNDVGILASTDPVAIDQASLDLIAKKSGNDPLKKAHPDVDYTVQLAHAEKIGLGSRTYELVEI